MLIKNKFGLLFFVMLFSISIEASALSNQEKALIDSSFPLEVKSQAPPTARVDKLEQSIAELKYKIKKLLEEWYQLKPSIDKGMLEIKSVRRENSPYADPSWTHAHEEDLTKLCCQIKNDKSRQSLIQQRVRDGVPIDL